MIKQPWVAYGLFLSGLGKIVGETEWSVDIMYTEGQNYPMETWNKKYIKRFDTPLELARFLVDHSNDSFDYIMELLKRNYPSDFIYKEKK